MLQVRELSFERNLTPLFSAVNFSLAPGEALQVTGSNGCGKTTLLKILCGLLSASGGEIHWQGKCIQQHRAAYQAALQYLGHLPGIRTGLTVSENLQWSGILRGSQSKLTEEILTKIGLSRHENVLTHSLSAGQQRRLLLAKLLLTKVPLWLLDEPFTALDHASVGLVKELITAHLAQGGLLVFTSHQPFVLPNLILKQLNLDAKHL